MQYYFKLWRQPLAVLIMALLALMVASLFIVNPARAGGQHDVIAYFGLEQNGVLPFRSADSPSSPYKPEMMMTRYNDKTKSYTVMVHWQLFGQDLKDCEAAGGFYIDPVRVHVNMGQNIINGVIDCSVQGRCSLMASGSMIDDTLIGVVGPIYEYIAPY